MKKFIYSILLAAFVTTQASAFPILKTDLIANNTQAQVTQIVASADESIKSNGDARKAKRKQNREEHKAKRKQKREERKAKRQDKGQEQKASRQEKRKERKANRQQKRQGGKGKRKS